MELSDFLGQAGSLYTAYTTQQTTEDAAKIQQAKAAEEAARTQGQFAITARTKTILLYSIGGIVAVILLLFVIKKLK